MSEQSVRSEPELSYVVTALMKGVVYRDTHERQWRDLLQLQSQARDYVATIGLTVVIDETEGYGYLQALPDDDEDREGTLRLVARRSLPFEVSLLLALLRKRLAQFDSEGGDTRLVLERDEIVEMLRVFLPSTSNEARLVDKVDVHVRRATQLGFLREVEGGAFEVRRILKAFVDAQWLSELDARLGEYLEHATGAAPAGSAAHTRSTPDAGTDD
ncbi:DUF4194 domain-containing protein [Sanguibacter antarcticus]|uniref:Uncharacterized protein DUF4194 n=1 Tax=Sanguibacter antarcticus TaxID=372484 RepID=A0A2A9E8B6_9MICO|nr:DUF4194 domain-containing protein [Sanguibacter antarcticus]PFG34479.1 uncharacterized protein DUF4194 [Sanguibacter antarcticus]